jgi:NNP family nitrate/nitrite transporter-like MFS transporter
MITRFFISLFSDKYGIRIIYSILLLATALIGILKILLIKYTTISRVLTGFYGILGGSFVLSETWVIIMFDVDNLGLITGIVGGLGNFGSAIVFLINYNLPNIYYCNWVYILMIILSFIIYKYSDDCPYGNFNEIIKEHNNNNRNLDNTIDSNYTNDNEINLEVIVNDIECNLERKCISMKNMKIFTLSLIYLYSFGLEMTLYSNIIILTEYENKSNKDKILVIFYFSILNIICRPIGGYISDIQYKYFKIIGKIKIMILFQLFTLIFGALYYNTMLIHYLILLSGCNNLLQGSIIGIIPHINSKNLGINLGVISGFGILGGIIGNILFYYFKNTMLYINIYNTFTLILNIFCLL